MLILSEKLHSVTSEFDRLRAIRFQDALNKARPRRKTNPVRNSDPADILNQKHSEINESDEIEPSPQRVQQQLLDDETRALQVPNVLGRFFF